MPLTFECVSHGTIAFGFFNIDSDMLLLEHHFFFATEFCEWIADIAERDETKSVQTSWRAHTIENRHDIGDLMGAIHGIHRQGFIGEVYRMFPFPKNPEDFKQKPEGKDTRPIMERLISKYGKGIMIAFSADRSRQQVKIGEYCFSRTAFQDLIKYVWRGGYPRWRDEHRPDYVLNMKRAVEQHQHWLFEALYFED
jgi:hypothetical protein